MNNKKILLGISGGVAAYKTLELIRLLTKQGAIVKVILTDNAKKFVTKLSISALGAEIVVEHCMEHIDLARWADQVLIAPATANTIAKLRCGLADDLLTSLCLACSKPIALAPAMNQQMWLNSVTQENISFLKQRDIQIWGPTNGSQACGEIGPGRMLEAQQLYEHLEATFAPKLLANKHVVITAGPTIEALDPVRYLSNHSSGKMGYCLAKAAVNSGAKVTLISGPSALAPPAAAEIIKVDTAQQMYDATMQVAASADYFIAAAAVCDYRPIKFNTNKVKKDAVTVSLELTKNPDILAAVSQSENRPITIGFAAETENLIKNAQEKLVSKNLDMIIANLVSKSQGFNQDDNEVVIIKADQAPKPLAKTSKQLLAYQLLAEIALLTCEHDYVET